MKKRIPKTVGLAWCGRYSDRAGTLGWLMPRFVSNYPECLDSEQAKMLTGRSRTYYPGDLYRVRVTLEAVRDKRGRYIVRRNKRRS